MNKDFSLLKLDTQSSTFQKSKDQTRKFQEQLRLEKQAREQAFDAQFNSHHKFLGDNSRTGFLSTATVKAKQRSKFVAAVKEQSDFDIRATLADLALSSFLSEDTTEVSEEEIEEARAELMAVIPVYITSDSFGEFDRMASLLIRHAELKNDSVTEEAELEECDKAIAEELEALRSDVVPVIRSRIFAMYQSEKEKAEFIENESLALEGVDSRKRMAKLTAKPSIFSGLTAAAMKEELSKCSELGMESVQDQASAKERALGRAFAQCALIETLNTLNCLGLNRLELSAMAKKLMHT